MAPINLPDGSQVSEIVLPDGSTALEVLAPDGSTVFASIPDSVVTRPSDTATKNVNDARGVRITSTEKWIQIGAKLSSKVVNPNTAFVYRVSDGTKLGEKNISSLTAGQTFTLSLSPSIKPYDGSNTTEYNFVVTAGTLGVGGSSFPYKSPDGNLEIINGAIGPSSTAGFAHNLVKVGDVGF